MPMYRDTIGGSSIEGVLTWGGWKPSLTAHTQEYFDKFKALNKMEPDFYSSSWAYAYVEVLGMAIEKAGSLDREKVKQALMTETFKDTVMGVDVKFENYFNQNLYSYVGQWRNGVLQGMWPKNIRTVQPVPKPAW